MILYEYLNKTKGERTMKLSKIIKAVAASTLALSLVVANAPDVSAKQTKTLTVGATTSPHAIILKHVKKEFEAKGYKLKIKEFSDYPEIDPSTSDGSLDANYFQHQPYLTSYNKDKGYKKGDDGYLVSAGKIHFEPMGIYSGKSDDLDNIADGAQIAIPNDESNEARALLLLQDQGLITLKKSVTPTTTKITLKAVTSNPHKLDLVEMDGAQIASKLGDVDFGIINGNYALDYGIDPSTAIFEEKDYDDDSYFCLMAVRSSDADDAVYKRIVELFQSETTKQIFQDEFNGYFVPAWEVQK